MTKILLFVTVLSVLVPGILFAETVTGKITAVRNGDVTVAIPEGIAITEGSSVEITWTTPDGDVLHVGSGRVARVGENEVTAKLSEGVGSVTVSMDAVIQTITIKRAPKSTRSDGKGGQVKNNKPASSASKLVTDETSGRDVPPITNPAPGMPGSKTIWSQDQYAAEKFKKYKAFEYTLGKKEQARKDLEEAANLGHLEARLELGAKLFEEAIETNRAEPGEAAIRWLTEIYETGKKSPEEKSRKQASKAAYQLSVLYYDKGNDLFDEKRALEWNRAALAMPELSAIFFKKAKKNLCYQTKPDWKCWGD